MKIKVSQLRRLVREHILLEEVQRKVPKIDVADVESLFKEAGIDEELAWEESQVNFYDMVGNIAADIIDLANNYAESPTLMSDAQVEAGLRAILLDPRAYGDDIKQVPEFMTRLMGRGLIQKIADKFKISIKGRGSSSADEKLIMSVMNSLMKLVKGDGQSPGLNKLADVFAAYDLEPEAAAANATLGPATTLMDIIAKSRDEGRFDKLGDKYAKSGGAGAQVAKAARADAPTKIS